MVFCSQYLAAPLRTLREACRDITAAHPELTARVCYTCPNRDLCAIYEQIEHDQREQVMALPESSLLSKAISL